MKSTFDARLRVCQLLVSVKGKETFHTPVLVNEVLHYLNVASGKKFIDATVGGGGHTAAILEKGGFVLGVDCDPDAVEFIKKRFAAELQTCPEHSRGIENCKLKIVNGDFKNIERVAKESGFVGIDGVLFDLGMSSWQIEYSGRGFSFQKDEPLDMRMDPDLSITAADLVNGLTENELFKLFKKYGQEKYSWRVAKAIARSRRVKPIKRTGRLAEIIRQVYPPMPKGRLDPATRCFQALRIAVNDEINSLKLALPQALKLLGPGGRLVAISFHSLEDKVVKEFFNVNGRVLTPKPVRASKREVDENPRASAAKLRALEKKDDS